MRTFLVYLTLALVALAALPLNAAQNAAFTFDIPNTGGTPTGYRVYRDNTLVGSLTSGQSLNAFFPNDTGTYLVGVEAFNATGPGSRVNKTVVLGPAVPGPVRNLVITLNCATTTPATCTVTVTDAP